jgi:hypothetical protein
MFHFKRFFPIYKCKKKFPLFSPPPWPSGTITCTSLNLHYVRNPSCKYEPFWLSCSQGKKISITSPNFCIYDHLPFEEDMTFRAPFTQGWFVPSLTEIGQLVLENIFFLDINTSEYGFPIVAPLDPWGPWFEETWIYIILESFHLNMTYSGSVVLEKKIFKWSHPIFAFL